jgi:hypothetical protein
MSQFQPETGETTISILPTEREDFPFKLMSGGVQIGLYRTIDSAMRAMSDEAIRVHREGPRS